MKVARHRRGYLDERRPRRSYLDWMRGFAVLIMIEAHLLDSWTRLPDRQTTEFGWTMILGGMGAPLFLFLAGVAIPLSAGSKLRKSGALAAASHAVVRRGLEIFGLAFVFRLQAWILGYQQTYFWTTSPAFFSASRPHDRCDCAGVPVGITSGWG